MGRYPPDMIVNALLYHARQHGDSLREMTHMKLQKLVFFMHAWGLALYEESPVSEQPQAWEYGPVFSSLYHILKTHGSAPITDWLVQVNPETRQLEPMIPQKEDHQFWQLLESVWERYGGFNAFELSALTHEDDSPWASARNANLGLLDDQEITDFYRRKWEEQYG